MFRTRRVGAQRETGNGEQLTQLVRADMLEVCQRRSILEHDRAGSNDVLYRMQHDAPSARHLVVDGAIPLLGAVLTVCSMLWVTLQMAWQLALIGLAITPCLFLLSRMYRVRMRAQGREVKKLESRSMSVVQEVLSSLRLVKVFGQEECEQERVERELGAQRDPRFVSLALRTSGDPLALTPAVRQAVTALNANLPIYNVDSMRGTIRQATWFYYVFGTLFIAFGAAALFMATVGLYGVLSFSVSRRTREMGIRMALGANARDVIRLILRQGGVQLGIGLGLGLVLALGVTRVIGMLMFETTPQDPPVFTGVVVVIASVGLLASLIPARRATRAHPTAALRHE